MWGEAPCAVARPREIESQNASRARYPSGMSSEQFILRVRGEKPVTPALWRAVWRIVWSRVEAMEPPSVHAFRAAYFEDLLPDHEERLMDLTPDAEGQRLTFVFPDFGGHFSTTITLLVRWFALVIGERYLQVHKAINDSGFRLDVEDLPRLEHATPDAVIEHEGRLHLVHREAGIVTLSPPLEDAAVLERAHMLLDTGTTEDPVWLWAQRGAPMFAAERAAHERTWMSERLQHLVASLSALSEPELLDAMLTCHHTPEATLWLEKKATPIARKAPEILAKHLQAEANHEALELVLRAYPSARAQDKDALAALVFAALDDAALTAKALTVELDDKHRDAAFFAQLTRLSAHDETLRVRAGYWALAALQRRWPKGAPLPVLLPLITRALDAEDGHFEAALLRVLDGRDWRGTTPLEEPVERALLARTKVGDAEIRWLLQVMRRREVGPIESGGMPLVLTESVLARAQEAGPTAAVWLMQAWLERVAEKPKRGRAAATDARDEAMRHACIGVLTHRDSEVRTEALRMLERQSAGHVLALIAHAVEVSEKDANSSAMASLVERLYVLTRPSTDKAVRVMPTSCLAASLSRGAGAVLLVSSAHWLAATTDPGKQKRRTMRLTWMLNAVATKESLALCCAVAEHAFATLAEPDFLYQWACALVRGGAREESATVLARAIALDPAQADDARNDDDFTQHRAHPAFAMLFS